MSKEKFMPLELRPEKNVITITIWGQEIEVYTKKPTVFQVQRYNSTIIGKKGLRIKRLYKTRVAFGKELIDGFRPGDLVLKGEPIDQDPAGRWKDVIEQECPQILEALARLMLDNTSAESEDNDDEDEDEAQDPEGSDPTYP
jgi:hypothetical protein